MAVSGTKLAVSGRKNEDRSRRDDLDMVESVLLR